MQSVLDARVDTALAAYERMPEEEKMRKLDEVLLLYTLGDTHVAEGLKLTYVSLMDAHNKIKFVDHLQQTLPMGNTPKIREHFERIDGIIAELTFCLFPNDRDMACELVSEGFRCDVQ